MQMLPVTYAVSVPSGRVCCHLTAALVALLASAFAELRCSGTALGTRHHFDCIPVASVAAALGQHPGCLLLIDGPTCTEASVRGGGCKSTRAANFTSCGAVLYNELPDLEQPPSQQLDTTRGHGSSTLSHCAYAARPAGAPCDPDLYNSGSSSISSSSNVGRGDSGDVGAESSAPTNPPSSVAGGTQAAAATGAGREQASLTAKPAVAEVPEYVCGGGASSGMCVLSVAVAAPTHPDPRCTRVACARGSCELMVAANEGGECVDPSAAQPSPSSSPPSPPPASQPCRRHVCRSGRCEVEPLPDGTSCGPMDLCSEHVCMAGVCVRNTEEDGAICGPSSVCSSQVCVAGECVEERQPDGRLCWHTPGQCPRACMSGQCEGCSCGSAFASWAGRRRLPGLQWIPFPAQPANGSFGGYFNLLEEELDIPPVQLSSYNKKPLGEPSSESSGRHDYPDPDPDPGPAGDMARELTRKAEKKREDEVDDDVDSAILVCSKCRLSMRLQLGRGGGVDQEGALVLGAAGLATSPVRGGTIVSLEVELLPNASHTHLLVDWNLWAASRPPPLHSPHRWGAARSPPTPLPFAAASIAASALGAGPTSRPPSAPHSGPLPRPVSRHSAWAFITRERVRWAFTSLDQVRSLYVGLHMTVASCRRAPHYSPSTSTGNNNRPGAAPGSGAAAAAAPAAAPPGCSSPPGSSPLGACPQPP